MPPSLGAYETVPHLWPFAVVNRALAQLGQNVADAARMELWEVGSVFGCGFPDVAAPDADMGTAAGRDVMAEHVEWLLARDRGEDPDPPVPDAPSRVQQETLMNALVP